MKPEHAIAVRRLLAFVLDWLVIVLWGGALCAVVMMAMGANPAPPENPWKAQAMGLLTMTIPVTLYFAVCESSVWQASLGKRALRLIVSRQNGAPLSFGRACFRNALKFMPWEFGHAVAWQAVLSGDAGFPIWTWGMAIVAFGCPVWWLVAVIATGRTPYDGWSLARVARAPGQEHGSPVS